MGLNFTELTTEVRDLLAKDTDSKVITSARVGIWLNEAQRIIACENPGLRDLHVLDKYLGHAVLDSYELALSDYSDTVEHIRRLWYYDIDGSYYHQIKPYPGGNIQWDENILPYLMDASREGYPSYYIRRDQTLEFDRVATETEAVLNITGATVTDANPSVITKAGEIVNSAGDSITLDGKYCYISGTNITTGKYLIASNDDDDITLSSNCSSGGAGSVGIVHVGGVYWISYSKELVDMSGTDDPTLTNFDLPLVYMAMSLGLNSPAVKRQREAIALEQQAQAMIYRRTTSEKPLNRSYKNPYQGP